MWSETSGLNWTGCGASLSFISSDWMTLKQQCNWVYTKRDGDVKSNEHGLVNPIVLSFNYALKQTNVSILAKPFVKIHLRWTHWLIFVASDSSGGFPLIKCSIANVLYGSFLGQPTVWICHLSPDASEPDIFELKVSIEIILGRFPLLGPTGKMCSIPVFQDK